MARSEVERIIEEAMSRAKKNQERRRKPLVALSKDELRLTLDEKLAEYSANKPVYVYGESVDQERRFKKAMVQSQGLVIPDNLREEEWQKYLKELEDAK